MSRSSSAFIAFWKKERVLAALRAKAFDCGRIQWDGSKLLLFPDMTNDVAEKRTQFIDVRKKLRDLDADFMLAYPAAMLCFP